MQFTECLVYSCFLLISFLGTRTVAADRYFVIMMFLRGSHILTTDAVLKSLANKGHNVSLLVPPIPEEVHHTITKNVNVEVINTFTTTEIMEEVKDIPKHVDMMIRSAVKGDHSGELEGHIKLDRIADAICESILSNRTLMVDLRQRQFDLVFGDIIYTCPILIAQSLQLRYTTLTTMIIPSFHATPHRSPINPSYIPSLMSGFNDRMTFNERLINTLTCALISVMTIYPTMKKDGLKEKYGIMPDISSRHSVGKAEIWFINSHFALDYSRPLVPSAVLVGGLTVKPPKVLNQVRKTTTKKTGFREVYLRLNINTTSSKFGNHGLLTCGII